MVLIMKSVLTLFTCFHIYIFFYKKPTNMLLAPSQPCTGSSKYISASAVTTGQTSSSPPNSLI